MTIEKKFNMFSTKEWIQYLQYKLSPDRERELEEQASHDPFLKDALDAISTQENRPVAFQSISYLISMVEENTGVSESRISKVQSTRHVKDSSLDLKWVAIIIGGLILAAGIGFGAYYVFNQSTSTTSEDISAAVSDTLSTLPTYADSSSQPFEVIPGTATPQDTVKTISSPTSSAALPVRNRIVTNSGRPTTSNQSEPQSTGVSTTASTENKESAMFNQAQDLYKSGNREEAKKLLKELNSYDNPKRKQAESILKNIEGSSPNANQ